MTNILSSGWLRPQKVALVRRGRVRLLEWTFPARRVDPRAVAPVDLGTDRDPFARPLPEMLDAFLWLAAQADEAVIAYARRWGVLGACWHGGRDRDHAHDTTASLLSLADVWPGRVRAPKPPGARSRPEQRGVRLVEHWRRYAATFAAVIRINFELRHERPGSGADWSTAWGADATGGWAASRPFDEQRWVVDELVARWQMEAHLSSRLSATAGRVDVDPAGLDAALVIFVVEAIRAGQTVLTCSACGRPYLRERPPRQGERNYCDQHERRAAWRIAQAARRERQTPEQREAERRASAARMKALRERRRKEGS